MHGMKSTERALLAVRRRKKISIALLVIFFVLFVSSLLGLSILQGASRAGDDLRRTFGSSFQIKVSDTAIQTYQETKVYEDGTSAVLYTGKRITPKNIHALAQTEGIKTYDAFFRLSLYSDTLHPIPAAWAAYFDDDKNDSRVLEEQDINSQRYILYSVNNTVYRVHLHSELAPEFRTGALELIEGRHITPDDYHAVLISDQLAAQNGLDIGDTYQARYSLAEALPEANLTPVEFAPELTIVGIFHVNSPQIVTRFTYEQDLAENYAFLDSRSLYEYNAAAGTPNSFGDATFFVEDPAELDAVMADAQAREDIPWEYFTLSIDDTEYQSAIQPLRTIQIASAIVVAVLVAVMLVLLYLILRLSLQGRAQEFRVYHALGIGKRSIFGQLVLECILLACLAFIPAAAVSGASAYTVGNAVLDMVVQDPEEMRAATDSELAAAAQNGTLIELLDQQNALQTDNTPEEIGVSLTPAVAASTLGVGISAIVLFLGWHLYKMSFWSVKRFQGFGWEMPDIHDLLFGADAGRLTFQERARLYITRQLSKTVRLGLIFTVLAVFLVVCSAVYQNTASSAAELRRTISATVRLEGASGSDRRVDDAIIEQVQALGNIRGYTGENMQLLYSTSVLPVPGQFSGMPGEENAFVMRYVSEHQSELAQDFMDGKLTLTQGRHIAPGDTHSAVISEDLAARNGLSLGDTITSGYAPSRIAENPSLAGRSYTFTIVGLFSVADDAKSTGRTAECDMRENTVYVDTASGHAIYLNDPTGTAYRYGVTFQVSDPRGLPELTQGIEDTIGLSGLTLVVNDKAYQDSVVPLERIGHLMAILIAVLTTASVLLIGLVLLLWIKQRTYEIGIYLSIGIPKREILLQFLLETLSIAAGSCILSIPLSLAAVYAAGQVTGASFFLPPSALLFLLIFALVFCVAAAATLLAARPAMRLNPRQIFAELK